MIALTVASRRCFGRTGATRGSAISVRLALDRRCLLGEWRSKQRARCREFAIQSQNRPPLALEHAIHAVAVASPTSRVPSVDARQRQRVATIRAQFLGRLRHWEWRVASIHSVGHQGTGYPRLTLYTRQRFGSSPARSSQQEPHGASQRAATGRSAAAMQQPGEESPRKLTLSLLLFREQPNWLEALGETFCHV